MRQTCAVAAHFPLTCLLQLQQPFMLHRASVVSGARVRKQTRIRANSRGPFIILIACKLYSISTYYLVEILEFLRVGVSWLLLEVLRLEDPGGVMIDHPAEVYIRGNNPLEWGQPAGMRRQTWERAPAWSKFDPSLRSETMYYAPTRSKFDPSSRSEKM